MPALFPRWSDTAFRIGLGAVAVSLLVLVVGPMIYVRTPYITGQFFAFDQPVQFDHRHHVQDDGIDCRFCHDGVDKGKRAGVPPTERCMGCHAQVWRSSVMLEPLRRSFYSGQPISWNRVHQLPDFVYFDHSIHVAKGVGCASCHGRVDEMAVVYQSAPLTMGWCLACHRSPEANLRPRAEITNMEWRQTDPAQGRELAREYDVRPPTNCTGCHR